MAERERERERERAREREGERERGREGGRERERECKIPLCNPKSYKQPRDRSLSPITQLSHNSQASFVHQAVVQS